ncbi:porin family protein [Flavobacterium haoranii]|uniref:Outer membrane protein beta-barrel domain-containing protein n=1 Tax=Flavobacterium haoranii TaxID=683124 RepID=A0A1M6LEU6_9FLAO|nr:porin family protein [Flavobacterium haoranii]SHJ69682.1 Outer membrane protein beta-barrel domain-containing protein [Flavobacterium haoranii]
MKKKILTTLCLIGFISLSNAQESSSTGARFGLKGGVNFTNLYVDDVDDTNMLTSFNAGVFVELPITQGVAIVPELNYSRKGSEVQNTILTETYKSKFKLSYLEMPVLLKLNLVPNFNLHAGPYVAYLLNAKTDVVDENGDRVESFEYDTDDFNKLDFGLSAGLGFDFNNFGIGARYNYGLSEIDKDNNANGAKNSAFNLYVALKF